MLPLPEGLGLSDVFRIGYLETSIQTHIRYGTVTEEGGRFFMISTKPTAFIEGNAPKPNPYSLRELERRGYKVLPGRTAAQDLVMVAPGAYCTISNAIRHGLITK